MELAKDKMGETKSDVLGHIYIRSSGPLETNAKTNILYHIPYSKQYLSKNENGALFLTVNMQYKQHTLVPTKISIILRSIHTSLEQELQVIGLSSLLHKARTCAEYAIINSRQLA
jgi:hypothetical protein